MTVQHITYRMFHMMFHACLPVARSNRFQGIAHNAALAGHRRNCGEREGVGNEPFQDPFGPVQNRPHFRIIAVDEEIAVQMALPKTFAAAHDGNPDEFAAGDFAFTSHDIQRIDSPTACQSLSSLPLPSLCQGLP